MRHAGVDFPAAVRILAEGGRSAAIVPIRRPPNAPKKPQERPSGLSAEEAESLLADARLALWGGRGAEALDYLRGRGLTDDTIKAAGLGWTPGVSLPTRSGDFFYRAEGVVIPWRDQAGLRLVKIRQPDGRKPKYAEAFRDRPWIYPDPRAVTPGKPVIVVEGEFDALLLGQELAGLASVITLGSASARPTPETLALLCRAPVWCLAPDDDDAGDTFAAAWPARARRVWPPSHCNDWTEAFLAGVGLRCAWAAILGVQEKETHDECDQT